MHQSPVSGSYILDKRMILNQLVYILFLSLFLNCQEIDEDGVKTLPFFAFLLFSGMMTEVIYISSSCPMIINYRTYLERKFEGRGISEPEMIAIRVICPESGFLLNCF